MPEFRVLWAADVLSVGGDQLARVALTVLVYGRTGSAAWAATTYALTYLPALFGGLLLSGLADRFRRRDVMITADLLRAVGIGIMAVPGLPLWLLCVLLVVVVLFGSPHTAAQGALMPEILHGGLYERGLVVRQISTQTAQLGGFAVGGLLVAAIGTTSALLVDAATFVASAVLLRVGLVNRLRPSGSGAAVAGDGAGPRGVVSAVAGIVADPRRRALVYLAWLVGWYVVPEGLAAPYAAEIGADTAVVGLLMAADPLGSVLGAWLFVRFVPSAVRERLVGVIAVCGGLPLLFMPLRPGVALTLVLWGIAGMCCTAYLLQTQASFVRATPDTGRGQAIGIAASGIVAGQGAAVFLGGLLADWSRPSVAIAVCGGVGALLALVGAVAWSRANRKGGGWAVRPAITSPRR